MPNNMTNYKIRGRKILVTGGAGFIGSNLIDSLVEENQVTCLDNFVTGKKENIKHLENHKNFSFIEGDIRNFETCLKAAQGCDLVLHQAALGSVPRSIADPKTTNDVNVGGFVNMLFATKEAGIKRFVFASSSSVYGDSTELPKVEERIGKPLSPYAISKLTNEIYAKNFSELYGMEIIGLRYFNVFGKRQDPNGPYAAVIPKFIMQMLKGEFPTIYGDGLTSRDFTHVDNVVDVIHRAATIKNAEAINQIYNVACGESITLNELFQILKTNLVQKSIITDQMHVKFERERTGDVKHSLASIEKAKKILGYTVCKFNAEGLQKTLADYLLKAEL